MQSTDISKVDGRDSTLNSTARPSVNSSKITTTPLPSPSSSKTSSNFSMKTSSGTATQSPSYRSTHNATSNATDGLTSSSSSSSSATTTTTTATTNSTSATTPSSATAIQENHNVTNTTTTITTNLTSPAATTTTARMSTTSTFRNPSSEDLPFRLRIKNMIYTDDLNDTESPVHIQLSIEIYDVYNAAVQNATTLVVDIEGGSSGLRYFNGSVISKFDVLFNGSSSDFSPYDRSFIDQFTNFYEYLHPNVTLDKDYFLTCQNHGGEQRVIDFCKKPQNVPVGMIVGVVVALFVAVILLIVVLVVVRRKRRRGRGVRTTEGRPQGVEEQGAFGSAVNPYSSPDSLTVGSTGGSMVWRGNNTVRSIDSSDSGSVFRVENLHRNRRSTRSMFWPSSTMAELAAQPERFFTTGESSLRQQSAGRDEVERLARELNKDRKNKNNKKKKRKKKTSNDDDDNNATAAAAAALGNNGINDNGNSNGNNNNDGSNRSQGNSSSVSSNSTSIQITKGSFLWRLKISRKAGSTDRISERDTSSSGASHFLPPEPQPHRVDPSRSDTLHRNPLFGSMPSNNDRLDLIMDEDISIDLIRPVGLRNSPESSDRRISGGLAAGDSGQQRVRTLKANRPRPQLYGRFAKKSFAPPDASRSNSNNSNGNKNNSNNNNDNEDEEPDSTGIELRHMQPDVRRSRRFGEDIGETSFIEISGGNGNSNDNNSGNSSDGSGSGGNPVFTDAIEGAHPADVNAADIFELKDLIGLAVNKRGWTKQSKLHRSDLERGSLSTPSDFKSLRTVILRRMERWRNVLWGQSEA